MQKIREVAEGITNPYCERLTQEIH